MLEELLKYDRFGSKDELLFLLFEALPLSNSQLLSDLKKYCISNNFSIGRSLDGSLKLLEFMSFINVSDGFVSVNDKLSYPDRITSRQAYFEQSDFIKVLLLSLKRDNAIADFIKPDALKFDPVRQLFYLKESLIPLSFFGLRSLMISIGLLRRDPTPGTSNLIVNEAWNTLFGAVILDSLSGQDQSDRRRISLAQLKEQFQRQEELGKEAETFVLKYEQQRLIGHPSIDKIRIVSEYYTNAGFDLESFNDIDSVFLDRFIEVKSYSQNLVFYWSQNEVQKARRLAPKYFLYLVDRDRMLQSNYVPRIFQNPYQKIFESEFWEKEPDGWKVTARQDNRG